MSEDDQYCRNV